MNPKPSSAPESLLPDKEAGPARILVVDDQPANIQIVGAVLGGLQHEIIPAADGATALKRMGLRQPDLILLDLLMPGMDGCEVCRKIKENPAWKDIPVIFLSAADDKDLIVRAFNAGGVDYITKPFNQAELISRVRTQLALKSARDRLARLAEDKDELIGILTHDLKNHIGGMSMSAELMSRQIGRLKDERLSQLADNILRSSSQLLAFVKEFLANAATDYGFILQPVLTNPAALFQTVVEQYKEAARRKDLRIETDFPAEEVIAFADPTAVEQVLENLLSNALKFSPPGKKVSVAVHVTEKYIECIIRDEGPGFTLEDKEKMFRRYGRLSARPTGGEPSTGLGLSIVRKLVQAMKGEIICETGTGNGTAFTVRLPRANT